MEKSTVFGGKLDSMSDSTRLASNNKHDDTSAISDAAALEALLSSAHKHEVSKLKEGTNNNNNNNGGKQQRDSWKRKERQTNDTNESRRPRKSRWGSRNETNTEPVKPPAVVEKEKPNFAVSNALAKDSAHTITTTDKDGVIKTTVSKYSEPPEARIPNTQWRLYVFSSSQGEDPIHTWHMSKQSAYIFGRDDKLCDVPLTHHPSISKQHAVLQYRLVDKTCRPYILDLESTNGTFVNKVRIDSARYYELKRGDVLRFGNSARDFVLLTEHSRNNKIF